MTKKKSTEQIVRTALLHSIFTELGTLLNREAFQLILINGAGGHLHHLAHTHKLKEGLRGDKAQAIGALQTRKAVQTLAAEIADIAHTCGVPLCTIQTGSIVRQDNNTITTLDPTSITSALKQGFVPLLGGDIVFDDMLGMSICSGDSTGATLCTMLPVTKLFFATDVDGVYTEDPHLNPDATLLENIAIAQDQKNYTLERSSHAHDTTDGLRGKVRAFERLFKKTDNLTEVHIFNGLTSENYTHIFSGTDFPHTVFTQ